MKSKNISTNLLFTFFFIFLASHSFGQKAVLTPKTKIAAEGNIAKTPPISGENVLRECGTVIMDSIYQDSQGLNMWDQRTEFEKWMEQAVKKTKANAQVQRAPIYTIPVIVHIIHNGEAVGSGRNISEAQVLSQIDVLNEDFRKMTGTPGYNNHADGADIEIEFCMALVDESGNTLPESGIERISRSSLGLSGTSYSMNYTNSNIKPPTSWDPDQYFNIWVEDMSGTTLGYAQFPSTPVGGLNVYAGGNANTDGVVIDYQYFGSTDKGSFPVLSAPYDKGRTATHEVGHCLGLHHIWGDGGCGVDDYCNDTPTSDASNYGCPNHTSCSTTDMVENYMDYTDDYCMNIFTDDQSYRMRTIMENSPRRVDLLTSTVCSPASPPTCAFTPSIQTIQEGGSVIFTDNSTNIPSSWSWTINGGTPSPTTTQNPSATYSTAGIYDVTLIATNGSGSCTLTEANFITVTVPPAPVCDFSFSPAAPSEGNTVSFTDLTANTPSGWTWTFESGSVGSSASQNPSVTWNTAGTYGVTLTASNATGNCTSAQTITVASSAHCDTLGFPYAGTPSVYTSDGGYLYGWNSYSDISKAEFYSDPGSYNVITGVLVWIAAINDNPGGAQEATVDFNIWDNSGTGSLPGNSPIATNTISLADLNTTIIDNGLIQIDFYPHVTVTGDFYAGISMNNFGLQDTLGLVTNGITDAVSNGAYEQWEDGDWYSIPDAYNNNAYQTNLFVWPLTTDAPANTVISTDINTLCEGNSVSFDGTSSTNTVSYSWVINQGTPNTSSNSTQTSSYTTAGIYKTYLTTDGYCGSFDNDSVQVTVTSPPTLNTSTTDASCTASDGSAIVNSSGGTAPLTYLWSSGGSTATENNLAANTYSVTVGDNNGCSVTTTSTVNSANSLSVSVSTTNSTCGNNNGSASTTLSGAAAPVTYFWSNGSSSGSINSLGANTYSVTVTDNNGCIVTASGIVTTTAVPSVNVTTTDALCGNNNGTATAVITGGTSSFSYAWNNGGNSSTETNLTANTYSVTITDANSCTASASNSLSNSSGPTVSITTTDATCGNNNGSATAVVTGGTGTIVYNWSNGGNSATETSLTANSYGVTITDDNSCNATATGNILNASGPSLSITTTSASCGNNNGTATANITGGATPYIYNWSTGGNSMTETGLSAGTKEITITDANSCSIVQIYDISNMQPNNSTTFVDETCGIGNGSISITTSGGATPYLYNWDNGNTENVASNLSAGIYYVSVYDSSIPSCLNIETITISNISGPSAASISITNETCSNSNGIVNAQVTGGVASYTYTWNTGATTQIIAGLSAAKYDVTITDSNNCEIYSTNTLQNEAAPNVNITVTDASCGINNGSASTVITDGTSPFTYTWSNGAGSASITGVAGGSYTVTVTDDNSCTITATNSIASGAGFTVTVLTTNATCGNNNASATAITTGGNAPFTYNWSNGGNVLTQPNLPAGSISVTVTDNSSCSTTGSSTINAITPPTASITVTNETCSAANGTASVIISGGTTPFTYNWNSGGATATITGLSASSQNVTITDNDGCTATANNSLSNESSPVVNVTATNATCGNNNGTVIATATGGTGALVYTWSNGSNSDSQTGLSASAYTITVSDDNSCTVTSSGTVNNVSGSTASITTTNETCSNNNGSATVIVSGGTGPFLYTWSNGGVSSTETGLNANTYSVTVSDINNCVSTANNSLSNLAGPSLAFSTANAACGNTNGSASAIVTGGTPTITYLWNNNETTSAISGISAGAYYVTITDGNSCTNTGSANVNNTGGPSITSSSTNEICGQTNGDYSITVAGGTTPYSYNWSNGNSTSSQSGLPSGNYIVTVNDNASCLATASISISSTSGTIASITTTDESCGNGNGTATAIANGGTAPFTYLWNDNSTTINISNLFSGGITVTISDNNGCSSSSTNSINNSSGPSISITSNNETCSNVNGSATAIASGGLAPYTYSWSNGATNASISNLSATTYDITISDTNGCNISSQITITNSAAPSLTVFTANDICNLGIGSASVVTSGGEAPFSFNWSSGSNSSNETSLNTGTYTVTVTDNNNCISIESGTVTNSSGPSVSISATDASCGLNNGTTEAFATGGTTPYSYNWSSGGNSNIENGMSAGSHTITVTDINGCMVTSTFGLSNNTPLASSTSQDATCSNSNGSITVTGSGGVVPYSYNWSNGSTTNTETGLTSGNYIISISDASGSGCLAIEVISISNIAGPTATITTTNETCNNANGTATVIPTGGTSGYSYLWSNNSTIPTALGLNANNYSVTITDANNCTFNTNNDVDLASLPTVSVSSNSSTCGNSDGTAIATPSNGLAPYSYSWSNNETTNSITNLSAGNYVVTVSDGNGCSIFSNVSVTDIGAPALSISATDEVCSNSNGTATASVSGGTGSYNYIWSNGETSAVIDGLSQNNYSVTVIDGNSCQTANSVSISMINGPSVTISTNDATCGLNNGDATVLISEGLSPYVTTWSSGSNNSMETNLSSGNHAVTITDDNSCTVIENYTIINISIPTVSITTTDATCGFNNGQGSSSIIGGTSPYTYNWSNGSNNSTTTGLAAENVSLTITDDKGCSSVVQASVNNEIPDVSITSNDASCNLSNGSASVTVVGGATPYSYDWSSGGNTPSSSSLNSGTHIVTITDANNCISVNNISIGDSPVAAVVITTTEATCGESNALATAVVTGGSTPYSFEWNTGAGSATITGIAAGGFSVTVTDASFCESINNIAVTNSTPELLTSSSTASCGNANGIASVAASGGLIPYSYRWSSGGTNAVESNLTPGAYTVTVEDASGCLNIGNVTVNNVGGATLNSMTYDANCGISDGIAMVSATGGALPYSYLWSTGGTISTQTGLAVGSYSVIVSDGFGCSEAINNILIENADGPTLSISGTDAICGNSDGMALVSITGGTSPYNIQWSSGSTNALSTGLSAGTYTATIIDDNSCLSIETITINSTSPPSIINNSPSTICTGDSTDITLEGNGGTLPYSYVWDNGLTTNILSGVKGGVYSFSITDTEGCQTVEVLTITELTAPTTAIIASNEICSNGEGAVQVSVVSNASPYTYNWSNGAITDNSSDLNEGSFYVTVTDNNGCKTIDSVVVSNIQPVINAAITNETCNQENGNIQISVVNGQTPYNFSWSIGESGAVIQQLPAGNYQVTLTDGNACIVMSEITVTNNAGPAITINTVDPQCGLDNGIAEAIVTGGTTPYSYGWNNGQNTQEITELSSGFYSLLLTDATNCVSSANTELEQQEGPTFEIQMEPASCKEANGEISVLRSGGTAPITFTWSNGGDSFFMDELAEGTYTITVSDVNNCSAIQTTYVESTNDVCITIPTGFTPNNDGTNDVWNILGASYYSDMTIEVYNRWGSILYTSSGGLEPWDGTFEGKELPSAVYYFIITVPSEEYSKTGTITIRR